MKTALLLLLAASAARAESAPGIWTFEPSQRVTFGTQKYFATDTELYLGMPFGANASVGFNTWKSETSSTTPTITFAAGVDHDQVSLGGSYSWTTLANNYRSDAVGANASVHTVSKDFRTTIGGDVTVTHHSQYVRQPAFTRRLDITQRTPTFTMKQQIYDTRVDMALSQSTYNRNVAALGGPRANQFSAKLAGLSGLVEGFPDYSQKFGISQRFHRLPSSVFFNYQSIKLVDTTTTDAATSDSYTVGAEADVLEWLSAHLEYNHLRQTSQPDSNQYTIGLTGRF
ncbi:MAG: hypothetical protein HY078_00805 [Elusimicrobia bacterium]|nr:hypothetical protein [Elusimicrobiota bacterium]